MIVVSGEAEIKHGNKLSLSLYIYMRDLTTINAECISVCIWCLCVCVIAAVPCDLTGIINDIVAAWKMCEAHIHYAVFWT